MKRIIYTTCGTSLLTSNCWIEKDYEISKMPALSEFHVERLEEQVEHEKLYRNYINSKKSNARDLANKFDMAVWDDSDQSRKLPAELASLKAIDIYCTNSKIQLSKADTLILLYADNDDAEFCANTIHYVLKEKNLLKITVKDTEKIINLKPEKIDLFESSIKSLWSKLSKDLTPGEEIIYYFNLTGGYKSIVILLACLAYAKGITDSQIFYLNEESGTEVLIMTFDPCNFIEGRFSSIKINHVSIGSKKSSETLIPKDY